MNETNDLCHPQTYLWIVFVFVVLNCWSEAVKNCGKKPSIGMTVVGLGNWVLMVVDAKFIIRFAELQSCNVNSKDHEFVTSSVFYKEKLCNPQIEDILLKCSGRPNCDCNGEGEGVCYFCYGDGKLDPKDKLHAKNLHLWSKTGRRTRNGMSSASPKQPAFDIAMEEFRSLMELTACKDVSNFQLLNAYLDEGQFVEAVFL